MGKFSRRFTGEVQTSLPPPPPLLPCPDLHPSAAFNDSDELHQQQQQQPLDYSMKRLLGLQLQPPQSPSPASSAASTLLDGGGGGCEQVLHRLRHAVLQRNRQRLSPSPQQLPLATAAVKPRAASAGDVAVAADPEVDLRAAYAAECIKSRLEGCGKRVHLFLGILLHFGMPPGPSGEPICDRVISFSDEQKNLSQLPTAYFMVLDSKMLALIWSKFKGNSSNEYSTLTRAIRSTRQKYKGIFESVANPGKRLYKFGPVACDQFRQLFPTSYAALQSVTEKVIKFA